MVKKILISTILGLIICIPVYAGWFSDFFRTEEENLSAANAGIIDWRYDRFKNLLYGNTNIDTFLIGSTTTSTTGTVFEVQGNSYLDGNATSTFFYASGDITAGGKLYGDGSNLTGITVSGGWATSSSDYWLTIQDTADLTEGTNLYYTDVRVGEYIDASTTMPVGDWNTAFGWGDHSLAGYYAAADYNTDWDALYNATSTFSGDLSISGNSTTTGYMYVGEDLTVNNQTSTSTINIYSEAADFGGSIIKEKEDGSGCTEQWSGSDGLEYFSDVNCP